MDPLPVTAVCACVVVPVWAELVVVAVVLVVEAAFLGLAVVVVCATANEPASNNTPTAKLEANSNSLFISAIPQADLCGYQPSTLTPPHTVDTTSESKSSPQVATAARLWYKRCIPVCFGRFEFHAEWLRDEPFDATTTGQNKRVPVSTLSWKQGT